MTDSEDEIVFMCLKVARLIVSMPGRRKGSARMMLAMAATRLGPRTGYSVLVRARLMCPGQRCTVQCSETVKGLNSKVLVLVDDDQ